MDYDPPPPYNEAFDMGSQGSDVRPESGTSSQKQNCGSGSSSQGQNFRPSSSSQGHNFVPGGSSQGQKFGTGGSAQSHTTFTFGSSGGTGSHSHTHTFGIGDMGETFFGLGSMFPGDEPTAPLLSPSSVNMPSLDAMFHGLPSSIRFEAGNTNENTANNYVFYIRDSMGRLHAKGTVTRHSGNVALQNTSGDTFLQIVAQEHSHAGTIEKYVVRHQQKSLGIVDSPAYTHIKLRNLAENQQSYEINSIRQGDIAISRARNASPICNIQMPSSGSAQHFGGSLVFGSQASGGGLTKIEQCLCVAVAVTFMVTQNIAYGAAAKEEANEEGTQKLLAYLCAFAIIVVIGVAGYFLFSHLNLQTCLKRKAKYPNLKYKDPEC